MFKAVKNLFILIAAILLFFAVASLFFYITKTPSNDRNWGESHQLIPKVKMQGTSFTIKNLRDYKWQEASKNTSSPVQYRDTSFDIADIESVEVGVSHFSEHEGIAHVFLVFGIKGQEDISLSVEARRTAGEEYTIIGGLTFAFDLAYYLTSKNDVLSIRALREEEVYLFKTIATPEESQALFKLVTERVNELFETPEFYHVFFKNCASSVVDHVEELSGLKFPFYEKSFAPGFSGKVLFDMGLLKTNKANFADVKAEALVDFAKLN